MRAIKNKLRLAARRCARKAKPQSGMRERRVCELDRSVSDVWLLDGLDFKRAVTHTGFEFISRDMWTLRTKLMARLNDGLRGL